MTPPQICHPYTTVFVIPVFLKAKLYPLLFPFVMAAKQFGKAFLAKMPKRRRVFHHTILPHVVTSSSCREKIVVLLGFTFSLIFFFFPYPPRILVVFSLGMLSFFVADRVVAMLFVNRTQSYTSRF